MVAPLFGIIVIGVSQGGMNALETLLGGLPADFAVPIVIVQHRSAESQGMRLASLLQRYSRLRVREPQDKETIQSGHIYLAPPDYHLLIDQNEFALSTEGPVSFARPSIDVLFQSAADAFAERAIAMILTGSNRDGAEGAARIKARGGILLVQEPETAECAAMPQAALDTTRPDRILPLALIAPVLTDLCRPNTLLFDAGLKP